MASTCDCPSCDGEFWVIGQLGWEPCADCEPDTCPSCNASTDGPGLCLDCQDEEEL